MNESAALQGFAENYSFMVLDAVQGIMDPITK
jgi:hypothetical protein